MEREKIVSRGLVLRVTDTKETDQILTVLSAELGRISVIAKGARSRRSRVGAACQLLSYSEMTLTQRGEWYYLNEASTLELFDGVRQDIVLLSLGAFFAEMTESVVTEAEAQEALRLLLNALYALGTLRKEPMQVETAFIFRLLSLMGFAPMVDGCAVCGAEPEKPLLDTVQGIVHCTGCKTGGLSLPLTGAALTALRYIVSCEDKKLYSFTLPTADLKLLCHAAEAYAAAQLERSFRTLDYYKSICGI